MSCQRRLDKTFQKAFILPFSKTSRFCLFSDCHRGNGTHNDNFLKNQHLYIHALQYYDQRRFTYIELGDGDELWENKDYKQIKEIHDDVFWQLSRFYRQNRLYMIYGNHDIIKKYPSFAQKKCARYYCTTRMSSEELFPNLTFYPGIILKDESSNKDLYLTHGHQASLLNSTFWPLSCFLVRYLWKPLEQIGILDPTSAAKNYKSKEATERQLLSWAQYSGHILITGHTHRPVIGDESSPYFNCGSCVHPHCVTCLELCCGQITLVKWYMASRENGDLFVERKEIASAEY